MSYDYVKKALLSRVYDVAHETPVHPMPHLSKKFENAIYLKREDMQPIFCFKIRGAYNKIAQLSAAEHARGIVTASAGNHAQGVAYAAKHFGIKATIVMPKTTPDTKVRSVRALGGHIVQHGDDFDQAFTYAQSIVKKNNNVYIPPFDDPDVIAGQATVGLELLRSHGNTIDAIFVPVGGGGLLAGIAVVVKQINPNIRVIGVEPEDANSMQQALAAGRRVTLKQVGLFADGVAVKQVGKHPFALCKKFVDEVITVSVDEICAAVNDMFDDLRITSEPSGALAVAGIKKYITQRGVTGEQLFGISSGANTNFLRLRYIAERAEVGEKSEALLAVQLPESAGSLNRFCKTLHNRNITEFNYRYQSNTQAEIFIGVRVTESIDELIDALQQQGYAVTNLTDNDLAKTHLRYMIGGRKPEYIQQESVYHFEFPERPSALVNFLSVISTSKVNITMFHYRNHGAAFSQILMGFDTSNISKQEFSTILNTTGYKYIEETRNAAYTLFLQ